MLQTRNAQRTRKAIAAAALIAVGTVTAANPAMAQRWERHHHGDGAGLAIGAGLLGLAVGAAIASDHPRYYRERVYATPVVYREPVEYDYPAYYYERPYPVYYRPYRDEWRWHHAYPGYYREGGWRHR